MWIIGCDFNPNSQQVAMFDIGSGMLREQCLGHREQAEQFYRSLRGRARLEGRKQQHGAVQKKGEIVPSLFWLVIKSTSCLSSAHPPEEL